MHSELALHSVWVPTFAQSFSQRFCDASYVQPEMAPHVVEFVVANLQRVWQIERTEFHSHTSALALHADDVII